MPEEPPHIRATYNDIHNIIRDASVKIAEWKPDMMVAIGESSLSILSSLLTLNRMFRWWVSGIVREGETFLNPLPVVSFQLVCLYANYLTFLVYI
jgi:hypothetical protein